MIYNFQVVGVILIILPVYSKFSQLLTSWPIIGGAIASGVFLLLIAIAGIYGAVRHNQIILFFVSLKKLYGMNMVITRIGSHSKNYITFNCLENLSQ